MPAIPTIEKMHITEYAEKVKAMCPRHDDAYIARYVGVPISEVGRLRSHLPMRAEIGRTHTGRGTFTPGEESKIAKASQRLGDAIDALLARQRRELGLAPDGGNARA